MNISKILATIDTEIAKLQEVRKLLVGGETKPGRGRPKKAAAVPVKKAKHKLSAEGRARIAAAQKARWAKAKKSTK
ncbi:MAG TPA: hypothetical protein VGN16_00345 [Acidobacteriaceae bacterium]|jgi:hypothetical protein